MKAFDPHCTQCPRLVGFLSDIHAQYPDYYCKPVPAFGDDKARLLIVGLAPGLHGANATGRPFTGDASGILLYETLHKHAFASQPQSVAVGDGLVLTDCRITNAVKCLPPQNKPTGEEVRTCLPYLKAEIAGLPERSVILALGSLAHNAVLRSFGEKLSAYKFGHNVVHRLSTGQYLLDSYHCSRYNTQTKRLTPAMFEAVFAQARQLMNENDE